MSDMPADLQLRLDAIRRRIQVARSAIGSAQSVDLSELTGEVQAVCETLRAAPLQIDRKELVAELEMILTDLGRLEQELTAQQEAMPHPPGGNAKSGD